MATRPEQIIDKNGKVTTVHKRLDDDDLQSNRLTKVSVPPTRSYAEGKGWPSKNIVSQLCTRIMDEPEDAGVRLMWGRRAEAIWAKTWNLKQEQVFVLGDGMPIARINDTNIMIDEWNHFLGLSEDALVSMIDSSSVDDMEKYEKMTGKSYGRSFGSDIETIANSSKFLLRRFEENKDKDDAETIASLKDSISVAFEGSVPLVILREDDYLFMAAVKGDDVFLIDNKHRATITTKDFIRDSFTNETAGLLFSIHVSNSLEDEHFDAMLKA